MNKILSNYIDRDSVSIINEYTLPDKEVERKKYNKVITELNRLNDKAFACIDSDDSDIDQCIEGEMFTDKWEDFRSLTLQSYNDDGKFDFSLAHTYDGDESFIDYKYHSFSSAWAVSFFHPFTHEIAVREYEGNDKFLPLITDYLLLLYKYKDALNHEFGSFSLTDKPYKMRVELITRLSRLLDAVGFYRASKVDS